MDRSMDGTYEVFRFRKQPSPRGNGLDGNISPIAMTTHSRISPRRPLSPERVQEMEALAVQLRIAEDKLRSKENQIQVLEDALLAKEKHIQMLEDLFQRQESNQTSGASLSSQAEIWRTQVSHLQQQLHNTVSHMSEVKRVTGDREGQLTKELSAMTIKLQETRQECSLLERANQEMLMEQRALTEKLIASEEAMEILQRQIAQIAGEPRNLKGEVSRLEERLMTIAASHEREQTMGQQTVQALNQALLEAQDRNHSLMEEIHKAKARKEGRGAGGMHAFRCYLLLCKMEIRTMYVETMASPSPNSSAVASNSSALDTSDAKNNAVRQGALFLEKVYALVYDMFSLFENDAWKKESSHCGRVLDMLSSMHLVMDGWETQAERLHTKIGVSLMLTGLPADSAQIQTLKAMLQERGQDIARLEEENLRLEGILKTTTQQSSSAIERLRVAATQDIESNQQALGQRSLELDNMIEQNQALTKANEKLKEETEARLLQIQNLHQTNTDLMQQVAWLNVRLNESEGEAGQDAHEVTRLSSALVRQGAEISRLVQLLEAEKGNVVQIENLEARIKHLEGENDMLREKNIHFLEVVSTHKTIEEERLDLKTALDLQRNREAELQKEMVKQIQTKEANHQIEVQRLRSDVEDLRKAEFKGMQDLDALRQAKLDQALKEIDDLKNELIASKTRAQEELRSALEQAAEKNNALDLFKADIAKLLKEAQDKNICLSNEKQALQDEGHRLKEELLEAKKLSEHVDILTKEVALRDQALELLKKTAFETNKNNADTVANLEMKNADLEAMLKQSEAAVARLNKELQVLEDMLSSEKEGQGRWRSEYEELMSQKLKDEADNAREEVDRLNEIIQQCKSTYSVQSHELETAVLERDSLRQELERKSDSLKKAKQAVKEHQMSERELQLGLQDAEMAIDQLREEIEKLKRREIDAMQQATASAEKNGTLQGELDEVRRQIDISRSKAEALLEVEASLRLRVSTLEHERDNLQTERNSVLQEKEDRDQKLAEQTNTIEHLRELLRGQEEDNNTLVLSVKMTLEEQVSALEAQLATCRAEGKEKADELHALKVALAEKNQTIEKLGNEIAELQDTCEMHNSESQRTTIIYGELEEEHIQQIATMESHIKTLQNELEELKAAAIQKEQEKAANETQLRENDITIRRLESRLKEMEQALESHQVESASLRLLHEQTNADLARSSSELGTVRIMGCHKHGFNEEVGRMRVEMAEKTKAFNLYQREKQAEIAICRHQFSAELANLRTKLAAMEVDRASFEAKSRNLEAAGKEKDSEILRFGKQTSDLEYSLKETSKSLADSEKDISKKAAEIAKLTDRMEGLEAAGKEKDSEVSRLVKQTSDLEYALKENSKSLADSEKEISKKVAEIVKLTNQGEEKDSEMSRLVKQTSNLEYALKENSKSLTDSENEISKKVAEIAKLTDQGKEKDSEISRLVKQTSDLEYALKESSKSLADSEKEISKKAAEIAKLTNRVEDLEAAGKEKDSEISRLVKQTSDLEYSLKENSKSLADSEKEISKKAAQITKLTDQMEGVQKVSQKQAGELVEADKNLALKTMKIENLSNDQVRLQGELSDKQKCLADALQTLKESQTSERELQLAMRDSNAEVVRLTQALEDLQKRMDESKQQFLTEKARMSEEQAKALASIEADRIKLAQSLKEAEADIRDKAKEISKLTATNTSQASEIARHTQHVDQLGKELKNTSDQLKATDKDCALKAVEVENLVMERDQLHEKLGTKSNSLMEAHKSVKELQENERSLHLQLQDAKVEIARLLQLSENAKQVEEDLKLGHTKLVDAKDTLSEKIQTLTGTLQGNEVEKAGLSAQLKAAQEKLQGSAAKAKVLDEQVSELEKQIQRLTSEHAKHEKALKQKIIDADKEHALQTAAVDALTKDRDSLREDRNRLQNDLVAASQSLKDAHQAERELQEALHQSNTEIVKLKAALEGVEQKEVKLEEENENLQGEIRNQNAAAATASSAMAELREALTWAREKTEEQKQQIYELQEEIEALKAAGVAMDKSLTESQKSVELKAEALAHQQLAMQTAQANFEERLKEEKKNIAQSHEREMLLKEEVDQLRQRLEDLKEKYEGDAAWMSKSWSADKMEVGRLTTDLAALSPRLSEQEGQLVRTVYRKFVGDEGSARLGIELQSMEELLTLKTRMAAEQVKYWMTLKTAEANLDSLNSDKDSQITKLTKTLANAETVSKEKASELLLRLEQLKEAQDSLKVTTSKLAESDKDRADKGVDIVKLEHDKRYQANEIAKLRQQLESSQDSLSQQGRQLSEHADQLAQTGKAHALKSMEFENVSKDRHQIQDELNKKSDLLKEALASLQASQASERDLQQALHESHANAAKLQVSIENVKERSQEQISELNGANSRIVEKVHDLKMELESGRADIQRLSNALQSTQEHLQVTEVQVGQYQDRVGILQDEKQTLQDQALELQTNLRDSTAESARLKDALQEALGNVTKLSENKDALTEQLHDARVELTASRAEVARLQELLEQARADISKLSEENAKLHAQMAKSVAEDALADALKKVAQLTQEKDALKEQLHNTQITLASCEAEAAILKRTEERSQDQLAKWEALNSKLQVQVQELIAALETSKADVNRLSAALQDAQEQLQAAETQVEHHKDRANSLEQDKETLQEEARKLEASLRDANAEIIRLQRDLEAALERSSKLDASKDELREQLHAARIELTARNAEIESLTKALQEANVRSKEASEHSQDQIQKVEADNSKLKEELEQLAATLDATRVEVQTLSNGLHHSQEDLQAKEEQVRHYLNRSNALQEDNAMLQEDNAKLQEEGRSLRTALESSNAELARLKDALKESFDHADELSAARDELKYQLHESHTNSNAKIAKLQESLDKTEGQVSKLEAANANLESQLNQKSQLLAEALQRLKETQTSERELQGKLRDINAESAKWKQAMEGTRIQTEEVRQREAALKKELQNVQSELAASNTEVTKLKAGLEQSQVEAKKLSVQLAKMVGEDTLKDALKNVTQLTEDKDALRKQTHELEVLLARRNTEAAGLQKTLDERQNRSQEQISKLGTDNLKLTERVQELLSALEASRAEAKTLTGRLENTQQKLQDVEALMKQHKEEENTLTKSFSNLKDEHALVKTESQKESALKALALENLSKDRNRLEKDLNDKSKFLEEALQHLKDSQAATHQLHKQLQDSNERMHVLLAEREASKAEVQTLKKGLQSTQEQLQSTQEQLNKHKTRENELQEEIRKLQTSLRDSEGELLRLQQALKEALEQVSTLNVSKDALKDQLHDVRIELTTSNAEVVRLKQALEQLQAEISKLEGEKVKLMEQMAKSVGEEALADALKKASQLAQDKDSLKGKLHEVEINLARSTAEADALRKTIDEMHKRLQDQHSKSEANSAALEASKAKVESLNTALQGTQDQLHTTEAQLKFQQDKASNLQGEREELQISLRDATAEVARLQQALKEALEQVSKLAANKEELKEQVHDVQIELTAGKAEIARLNEALEQAQMQITTVNRDNAKLQEKMSNLVGEDALADALGKVSQLSEDKDVLKEQLQELKLTLVRRNADMEALKKALEDAQKRLEDQAAQFGGEKSKLNEQLEEAMSALEANKVDIETLSKGLQSTQDQLQATELQVEYHRNKASTHRERASTLERSHSDLAAGHFQTKNSMEKDIALKEMALTNSNAERDRLENELKKALEHFKEAQATERQLQGELRGSNADNAKLTQALAEARERIEELKLQVAKLEGDASNHMSQNSASEQKYQNLLLEIERLKADGVLKDKGVENFEQKVSGLAKNIEGHLDTIANLKATIANLEAAREATDNELKRVSSMHSDSAGQLEDYNRQLKAEMDKYKKELNVSLEDLKETRTLLILCQQQHLESSEAVKRLELQLREKEEAFELWLDHVLKISNAKDAAIKALQDDLLNAQKYAEELLHNSDSAASEWESKYKLSLADAENESTTWRAAHDEMTKVMEGLQGKIQELAGENQDLSDQVQTFSDAYTELQDLHALCQQPESPQSSKPQRKYIGVELDFADLSADYLRVYSLKPGGPAMKAGLKIGDKILTWGGERCPVRKDAFTALVGQHEIGDEVPLTINRHGKTLEAQLTIGGTAAPAKPSKGRRSIRSDSARSGSK